MGMRSRTELFPPDAATDDDDGKIADMNLHERGFKIKVISDG